ncbi:MAG: hypothetical protein ACREH4_11290, partial [Vitreimonas sp.]
IDAFIAARLQRLLDSRKQLSLGLTFSAPLTDEQSPSYSTTFYGPKPEHLGFGYQLSVKPKGSTDTLFAATLESKDKPDSRKFFDAPLVSIQGGFRAALRKAGTAAIPAAGVATGTLRYQERRAVLAHAYAYTVPEDSLSGADERRLVLSEVPIPQHRLMVADTYLEEQHKLGAQIDLSNSGHRQISLQILGTPFSGSSSGSDSGVELAASAADRVAGQTQYSSDSAELDARFNAVLVQAPQPKEFLTGDAAARSAYAHQFRDCTEAQRSGDLKRIRKLFRAADAADMEIELTGADKELFLQYSRKSAESVRTATIEAVSVRDDVKMTFKKGAHTSRQTVLTREADDWKCSFISNPLGDLLDAVFSGPSQEK